MKRMFLEKFFPASKTTSIRKEIYGIRQHNGETLYEYWERSLRLGTLELTSIAIQLANRSIAHSLDVLEDMLVQDLGFKAISRVTNLQIG
ncbi:hypothetical protein CR513_12711, partial [Mucuna pruriens]